MLAFIDSDCVADATGCGACARRIEGGAYDGVGGAIGRSTARTRSSWAGYFCEFREFLPGGAADRRHLPDAGQRRLSTRDIPARRRLSRRLLSAGRPGVLPAAARGRRAHPVRSVDRGADTTTARESARSSRIRRRSATRTRAWSRALDCRAPAIASHPWLAAALLPALATYRFARTMAACWTQERCLMLRRPAVAGLCWLGMFGWGDRVSRAPARPRRRRRASLNAARLMATEIIELDLRDAPDAVQRARRRAGAVRDLVTADGRPVQLLRLPRPADGVLTSAAISRHQIAIAAGASRQPTRLAGCASGLGRRAHARTAGRSRAMPREPCAGSSATAHEVIVVDNGPTTDRTAAVAARFGVRYVARAAARREPRAQRRT